MWQRACTHGRCQTPYWHNQVYRLHKVTNSTPVRRHAAKNYAPKVPVRHVCQAKLRARSGTVSPSMTENTFELLIAGVNTVLKLGRRGVCGVHATGVSGATTSNLLGGHLAFQVGSVCRSICSRVVGDRVGFGKHLKRDAPPVGDKIGHFLRVWGHAVIAPGGEPLHNVSHCCRVVDTRLWVLRTA